MKKQIREYLLKLPTNKGTVEEIKSALQIESSADFIVFMKQLNEMIDDAEIIENAKHEFALIEHTNYLKGILDLKQKGFGFVMPEDVSLDDVFVPKDSIFDAMNRDLVLVHLTKHRQGFRMEGEIKRILKHNYTHLMGYLVMRDGLGVLIPDDKTIHQDVIVKHQNLHNAKKNDIVQVHITNYSFKGKIEGEVVQILGNKNQAGMDVLSKIMKYNINPVFPDEVIAEAKQFTGVSKEDFTNRRDLTNDKIITIDGDDSKDFDDAVIVYKKENGNYHLGVHIADVSHYVTKSSVLDQEAYLRGTSVYLPGRVVPMLPENLSNGICSLVPGEERLTVSCDMEIDQTGKVVKYEIFPSVIKSAARMTYSKINKIFMGDVALSEEYVDFVEMFYDMRNLAKILKKKREVQGSINFESDESYITLDDNGKAVDIKLRDRGVSENIIEEFMLKANQVVSEHVFWLNLPFIYRIHDKPKEEKLQRLLRMANALGFHIKAKSEISHLELQKLLDNVSGTDSEKGINLLVLRSMQKAIYSEVNLGHYGLNFKYYTHFTSPIRRYPDLIVHRLLREYLFEPTKSTKVIEYYSEHMKDIAAKASETERNAMLCEREVVDMKKAEYITQFINQEFDGIINSVTSFGLYVTLDNTVEGLVHIKELDDYYHYDEDLMMLVGERKKHIYRVGDHVKVKVTNTNIPEGEVDFKMVK